MGAICGIFSFARERPVDQAALQRMSDAQVHRGPDHAGFWIDKTIGLAQRQLGLDGDSQRPEPLTSRASSTAIAFSGRLFNRREIRETLAASGVNLPAGSDAELALRMYERLGENCLSRFNGQFSFAVWDGRARSLFLARDALGICPLHYAFADGELLFSSEAKGILAHAGVQAASDGEAVAEALLCGAVFHGRSMFAGISSLNPGSTLTVSVTRKQTSTYWEIPAKVASDDALVEPELVSRLSATLEDAIRIRIASEAEWGVLLSGGTDSSALTAWCQRLAPQPAQTFSIDFTTAWKGADLDKHYSAFVAERLGTRHHPFLADPEDYFSVLDKLTWHCERPYNKAAATMHLVARKLAPHARFALSGEGVDEMLAGYVGARGLGLDDRISEKLDYFPWAPYAATVLDLLSPDFCSQVRATELFGTRLREALARAPTLDPLNQKLYLYTAYFLRELLALHEQGSLAAGVETRFPFIDARVVELLAPLPSSLKFRDGQTKVIFRAAIQGLVPVEVLDRRKTHLPMPRDPAAIVRQLELARNLLLSPESRSARYFDVARLTQFLDGRSARSRPDTLTLWQVSMNLITLELLHRAFRL